ncbi:hypothetical protein V0M98_21595 [Pseudomonas silesiensis]|uniref:hypothetical protein n=1 Tax=Pseudomonas silesiensis TaxID=1853130 RepID=UPI0030D2F741
MPAKALLKTPPPVGARLAGESALENASLVGARLAGESALEDAFAGKPGSYRKAEKPKKFIFPVSFRFSIRAASNNHSY